MIDTKTLRDAWLVTSLEEVGGREPPDLAEQILASWREETARGPMPPVLDRELRRPTGPLLAAAVLLGSLAIVASLTWLQNSASEDSATDTEEQDKKKRSHPMSCREFFPLRLGARWEFDVIDGDPSEANATSRMIWTVTATNRVGKETVAQIEADDVVREFLYFATDDSGIYRYANAHDASFPGPDPKSRIREVAGPMGLLSSWKFSWREPHHLRAVRRQHRVDRLVPPPDAGRIGKPPLGADAVASESRPPFECEGRLSGMSETIEVPAGRFETVQVTIDRVRKDGVAFVERRWYARGVGMVRRIVRDADGQGDRVTEWRLRRYTPGRSSDDPESVLATWLAADPVSRGAPDKIDWVALGEEQWVLQSRFVRVARGDQLAFFRVHRGRVVSFAPLGQKDFMGLISDEDLIRRPTRHFPYCSSVALAALACRLRGVELGLRDMETKMERAEASARPDGVRDVIVHATAVDSDGKRRKLICHLRIEKRRIVALEIEQRE